MYRGDEELNRYRYEVRYLSCEGNSQSQSFLDLDCAVNFMCVYDPDGMYPMEIWDITNEQRVIIESNYSVNFRHLKSEPKVDWEKEGF